MTPSRPPHLVLVGLMGAGKTTIGQRCAERLGRPFIDTDDLVEQATGRTIADIFATDGEATFRAFERDAVARACAETSPAVIACGGGAVLDASNREQLRNAGVVIWLRAAPDTLAARVPDDGARPLLRGDADPRAALERLHSERAEAYHAAAHHIVDTDGLSVKEAAERVLGALATCVS